MTAPKNDTPLWQPAQWREAQPQQPQQRAQQQNARTSAGGCDTSFLNTEDPHGIEPFPLPPLRPARYVAFRLGRTRPSLRIDTATQGMHFPAYHALHDVLFDGDHQATIILLFHTMSVEIRGEILWPVAYAIAGRRCEAIHQYHPDLYDEEPQQGETVIREINFGPPALSREGIGKPGKE